MKKILQVKVTPKASKSEVVGLENDVLRVRLKAVPEKGKANEELIATLADYFNVSKSSIEIVSGHSSRLKKVVIYTETN